ncbi:MAG: Unknown protein [uncultured Aureispira sp.]|uniref:Secretion system C-terminal sorting domain-containing protein n=1 Tax=uncultured Aureispira sp. TaxID=1331704 RepID=A0A6S6TZG7_9BACT|nr:MAG: Unknown protein [uncultured Aureispira sp.]
MKKQLLANLFLCIAFLCFVTSIAYAQPNKQYYWKGNSGDFNDPAMWWIDAYNSGTTATQAPNSTNSVFFTAAAFTVPNITVNVNANASCDSLMWDDTILPTNTPILSGNSAVSIGIYGSFALAENLDVQYQGMLRFRSQRNGIETIDPKGKMLRLLKLDIDGSANTEFQLLSKLHVEDFNNILSNTLPSQGGFIELLSGTFNTNGQDVSVDFFHSDNNNASRGLILNNSKIEIDGRHSQYCWKVDFNSVTNNYTNFDATGSHLHFSWYYGYDWVAFGTEMDYDTVTMKTNDIRAENYTGVYCYLNLTSSKDCSINHLLLETRLYFIYSTNTFTVKNLYFESKRASLGWHTNGRPTIQLENVFAPNYCDHFFPMAPVSNGTNKMTISKMTPGTLNMNNMLLENVDCDITGGRSYIASNSIDGNNNDPNWTITPPTTRELYFRDNIDDNWHTLGNWEEKVGASFVAATCLPTPSDNVFIDASSYASHTLIRFDSLAYCHDLTFDNAIPAGSVFRFYNTLNLFGDLNGCPNVDLRDMGQGYIYAFGPSDTIQMNGAAVNVNLYLEIGADYEFVGDYNAPNHNLYCRNSTATIRAKSSSFFLQRMNPAQVFMDSTQVYLYGNNRWAMADAGGLKTYTGTTTFHFQPTTNTDVNMGVLPNVIFYGPATAIYFNTTIQGDITLMDNANFSYSHYGVHTSQAVVNVTGSMALYNGDMNLTSGKQYVFPSRTGSSLTIAGNLNAIGSCADQVVIGTNGYDTGIIPITVNGSTNLNNASLQGLDNTGNPPIVANNSIDGGDNTNITFTTSAGATFYWRAHQSNAADFVGDWSDAGHWTINPASLVGDNACIPTILDSVIFDANSFSPTSNGCTVDGIKYCRSLIFRADARLIGAGSTSGSLPESPNRIYIDESFMLANAMTNFDYRGSIHMVGSGDINTNGTTLEIFKLEFDNPLGTWDFQGDLVMDNSWSGNIVDKRYGIFSLEGGTVNTNNYNLTIASQFTSNSTANRTLNLGSSVINHLCNGAYYIHWAIETRYPWDVQTATNFTLNTGTSQIIFANNTTGITYDKNFYMGDGLSYNQVRFEDIDDPSYVHNSVAYGYVELLGTTYLYNENSFDSLSLEGGQYYYLGGGNRQTLNSPHGKLITNGSSSSFIFIESTTSGTPAILHKAYGYAFCLDFVKVKDVDGTREPVLAAVPPAFQSIHAFLEFETGVNSDNINNSATGIWTFYLPALITPHFTGSDSIELCKFSSPQLAPFTFLGTGPYYLDYTWTDNLGGSGTNTLTFNDDDNDPATPYVHYISLPTMASEIQFNLNVQTSRCGKLTLSTPVDVWTFAPEPDTLVNIPTTASCELNNESLWFTFMDDMEGEPIAALRDSISASDNHALGMTNVEVFFDPTIQTVNYMGLNYPYLERHWDIVPTNNGAARVRLFFTQAELDNLAGNTYWGPHPNNPLGTLDPATDLQLLKYSSGTIGVGTPTPLTYTVVPMTGGITNPFADLTDVIAIEFEVTSFSHFILIPQQTILLTLDLSIFDAHVVDENKVAVDWTVASEQDVDYYEVERSQDAIEGHLVQRVHAKGLPNTSYAIIDNDAYKGTSYYRVKAVDYNGGLTYSDWKMVEIKGWDVVRIYPVPTADDLNIELTSNQNDEVTLTVYDALGALVHQEIRVVENANQQKMKMNTSQLSGGVYYLSIANQNGYTQQRKFIIQK